MGFWIALAIILGFLVIYSCLKVASDADDHYLNEKQYHNNAPDKIEPTHKMTPKEVKMSNLWRMVWKQRLP